MASIGAVCLDKTQINRPPGIRLADYQVERHAIAERQIETSVVLANPPHRWVSDQLADLERARRRRPTRVGSR